MKALIFKILRILLVSAFVYSIIGIFTFQIITNFFIFRNIAAIKNEVTIQEASVTSLHEACDIAIAKSQAWDKRCKLASVMIRYENSYELDSDNPTYIIYCSFIESYQLPFVIDVFLDDGSQIMANATSIISGNKLDFSASAANTSSIVSRRNFILWKGEMNSERVRYILSILKYQYHKEWDSEGWLFITYLNDSDWLIEIRNKNEFIDIIYNSEYENFFITEMFKDRPR